MQEADLSCMKQSLELTFSTILMKLLQFWDSITWPQHSLFHCQYIGHRIWCSPSSDATFERGPLIKDFTIFCVVQSQLRLRLEKTSSDSVLPYFLPHAAHAPRFTNNVDLFYFPVSKSYNIEYESKQFGSETIFFVVTEILSVFRPYFNDRKSWLTFIH